MLTEKLKELSAQARAAQRTGDAESASRLWRIYHEEAYRVDSAAANRARRKMGLPLSECRGRYYVMSDDGKFYMEAMP